MIYHFKLKPGEISRLLLYFIILLIRLNRGCIKLCIEKEDIYKNIVDEFSDFVKNDMVFWDNDGELIKERWEEIKDKYIESN